MAERPLARAEERARRTGRAFALAASARTRALVHAAGEDLDRAQRETEAALEHHARLDEPFDRARTLLAHGTILRRAGERSGARAALEEAHDLFSRLGGSGVGDELTATGRPCGARPDEPRGRGGALRGGADRRGEGSLIHRKLGVRSRTGWQTVGDPADAEGAVRLRRMTLSDHPAHKSVRCCDLVARGHSDHDIARRLAVSGTDAEELVRQLIQTLGLRDCSRAVIFAYECGLVTPSAAPQTVAVALLTEPPSGASRR